MTFHQRIRQAAFLLVALTLFSLPALAQNDYPRAEVFAGYSYFRADAFDDNMHGFETSGAWNFHRNLGLEVDFSGHYSEVFGTSISQYFLMAGPRVAGRTKRFTPWAHLLLGASHIRGGGDSSTDLAGTVGGGLDANVNDRLALRLLQVDYIVIRATESGFSDTLHNARVSAGVVFKF